MGKCPNCKKEVGRSRAGQNRKYCDEVCRVEFYNRNHKRTGLGLPTASTGAVSELIVAADLLKKGWEVYRAVSQSAYCDILAMKRGDPKSTLYIEVRTGHRFVGTGNFTYPKKKGEEDKQFAVVIHGKEQEIIYIPPLP